MAKRTRKPAKPADTAAALQPETAAAPAETAAPAAVDPVVQEILDAADAKDREDGLEGMTDPAKVDTVVEEILAADADKPKTETNDVDPIQHILDTAVTDENALAEVAADQQRVDGAVDDILAAAKDTAAAPLPFVAAEDSPFNKAPEAPAAVEQAAATGDAQVAAGEEPVVAAAETPATLTGDEPPAPPAAPETEMAPAPKKKGWLGVVFHMAASAGLGVAVGMTVKATMLTAFGSAGGAVVVGAMAVGLSTTALQRVWDIREHNKAATDENKLHWRKDFMNFAATGHSMKHYAKRAALSTGFGLAGGFIGLHFGDKIADMGNNVLGYLGLGGDTVPVPGPDVAVGVDTPIVDTPVVETPVVEAPVVETPVIEAPVIEAPVVETPVVEAPVIEAPVVEAPAVDTPAVEAEPVPVPVPTLDERVAATLEEVYGVMPETPGRQLAETLARLESANDDVKAQALKDLGYFFANGFARLPENDALANKLFELSIEVSGGDNYQAMHDLGYHLIYGKGIDVDIERGRELLQTAADNGNRLSIEMLAQSPVLRP